MRLSADNRLAQVELAAELDSAGVESLIRELAELRAQMLPPVAAHRRDLDAEHAVLIESEPGLFIAARASGGFRLWVRNRGFGWVAYEIGSGEAVGLARYILSRTGGEGVDLIGHDEPNRH